MSLFFNTWNADEKYSLGKMENLPQPTETQLSKKLNKISQFFVISEIYIKFWTFEKKDQSHSWCISEIRDWEKRGYLNILKALFWNTIQQLTS